MSKHPMSTPCVLLRLDDMVYFYGSNYILGKVLHCWISEFADAYVFPSVTQARKYAIMYLGMKHREYRIIPLVKAARRWYT